MLTSGSQVANWKEKNMTNHDEESSCGGSWLAGLLIGGMIGVACGMLFAPKAGSETRAELAERMEELKERIDETTHTLMDAAKTRLQDTRADVSEAVQAGRAAAKDSAEALRRQVGLK
jgi:gas vesicle protein